jgi:hypothetical protein
MDFEQRDLSYAVNTALVMISISSLANPLKGGDAKPPV